MIDHVSLRVSDLQKSREFYLAALKPLGYGIVHDIEDVLGWGLGLKAFSVGQNEQVRLWLDGDNPSVKTHIAFAADTKEQVNEFHYAALQAGGTDNGAPGIREQYAPNYYAAFVLDPDGNNIEVVCRLKQ